MGLPSSPLIPPERLYRGNSSSLQLTVFEHEQMHNLAGMVLGTLLLLVSGLFEYAYHVKVSAQLPTVDLSYAIYRATALNVSLLAGYD